MAKISKTTMNKLVNQTVTDSFDNDQAYRTEAKKITDDFTKKFGIFVGLYNKLNSTKFSVEQALQEDALVDTYFTISDTLTKADATNKPTSKPTVKSTKALSYEQFKEENGDSVAHLIYNHLNTNGFLSRREIATQLKLRLSSVCGRIAELEEAGLVYVCGTKLDTDSNRMVELISSCEYARVTPDNPDEVN